ncbi:MAG TPA: hypothetical protein VJS30_16225 [Paraburkholderia sp.]|nr:hypothetical protein [Paraburkholderia sp.]
MQFWTPEQAISLSLHIDPDQPVPEHLRTSYAERLRELQGAIEANSTHLTMRHGKVERSAFVFWASQCEDHEDWKIPRESPLYKIAADEPIQEQGELRSARRVADMRDNGWHSFSLEDGDAPAIDCEKYIEALVRAKYQDGPDLAPEENDAIREGKLELLRQSVEAAAHAGKLTPRGRDFLPMSAIPRREWLGPFDNLYFERQSFLAFAEEAWLVSPTAEESPEQAQRITVEDIAHMIAVQRADQTISLGENPDEREGVRRSIELALHLIGWPPDGIPGVVPQIAELARNKVIRLHGPVETDLPEVADVRARPGLWSLTAEDAQRVLASLCPGVRRYTVADVGDIIARRSYPHDMAKVRETERALVERIEGAIEQGELTVNERRKDGEILLNEHSVDEWLIREQIPALLNPTAQANIEQGAMEAAGRLRIDDVVRILATETGREAARWESTIVAEIRGGALPLKNPRDLGDFLPYAVPKNLRTFYDRVDVADVNKLLDAHPEWRVTYRFPITAVSSVLPPVTETESSPTRPPLQQQHQESEILRVIRDLGEDPKKLPKQKPGKPGIKAAVRAKLSFSEKVFDKAWERLRDAGDVADA